MNTRRNTAVFRPAARRVHASGSQLGPTIGIAPKVLRANRQLAYP